MLKLRNVTKNEDKVVTLPHTGTEKGKRGGIGFIIVFIFRKVQLLYCYVKLQAVYSDMQLEKSTFCLLKAMLTVRLRFSRPFRFLLYYLFCYCYCS